MKYTGRFGRLGWIYLYQFFQINSEINSVELRSIVSLSCATYPWIIASGSSGAIRAINWDYVTEPQ